MKRTVSGVVEESTYTYDDTPAGATFTSTVTDARGNTTTYKADYANRVQNATNAAGDQVDTGYDDNSNITTVTSGGQTFTNAYSGDSRNNLTSQTSAAGVKTSFGYNGSATTGLTPYQPKDGTDPQGNKSQFTWDSAGNLQQSVNVTTQDSAKVERQGINSANGCGGEKGQVCKTTNPKGVATTFSYGYGYLLSVTKPAPLGGQSFTYDQFGRTQSVVDGKNQTRTFTYDPLDRLTNAAYAGGVAIGYGYDDVGNTTSRNDNGTPWAMTYDAANRITSIDGPNSPAGYPNLNDVTFTYDKVGNLTSLTDVGGTTAYSFTNLNVVDTITDPDGGVTTYQHGDTAHETRVTSIDYANGTKANLTYDTSGRQTGVINYKPDNSILTSYSYQFRKNGSNADNQAVRTKETTAAAVTAYSYDARNRLTGATTTLNGGGPVATYGYGYDPAGNRTSKTTNGSTSTYSYNNADELTTAGVTHDANGNMTAGGAHGYTAQVFNALDQATSVTPKGASARSQAYGGQTQSTWLADGTTRFANAGSIGITATAQGSTVTTFVRDPAGRLISMKRGANRYHYLYDARGSVDALTDNTGNGVQYYRYDPWGRLDTAATIGTINQPFRWNAAYALNDYDYKIGARRYDASIARWTQTDPSGQEANNYAYANNDPINQSDPSGLLPSVNDVVDALQFGGNVIGIFVPEASIAINVGNLAVDLVQSVFADCPVKDALKAGAEFIISTATFGALSEAGYPRTADAVGAVVDYALDRLDYEC